MNPIYIGNCDIEEIPGSKLTIKRGQAAVLRRVFQGNVNNLNSFLTSNPILNTTDDAIPSMVLDELDIEMDGPQATVTMTFYGLPGTNAGNPGQLQSDTSWMPRSTILGTDVPGDGLWTVNYKAPTITFRYSISSKLSDAQYQDYAENPSDITITDAQQYSIPGGGPLDPGFVRQGNFQFDPFPVCDNFRREQKGTIYNYEETWAVIIQKKGATSTLPFDGGGDL